MQFKRLLLMTLVTSVMPLPADSCIEYKISKHTSSDGKESSREYNEGDPSPSTEIKDDIICNERNSRETRGNR